MSGKGARDPHADATRALTASCPRMAALIREVGPCALGREVLGPFHTRGQFAGLVEAIVSQQLSSKAAATIFARVEALAPGGALTDPRALLELPEADLRGAGLRDRRRATSAISRRASPTAGSISRRSPRSTTRR